MEEAAGGARRREKNPVKEEGTSGISKEWTISEKGITAGINRVSGSVVRVKMYSQTAQCDLLAEMAGSPVAPGWVER